MPNSAHALPELPRFMQRQYAFTAYLRDPENTEAPDDVSAERMEVYRELVYNNIEALLANAFPVLHRISCENDWHRLVRDFIVHHRARTPYFHRLPEEFLHYLTSERKPSCDDYPFLLELADYEWLELSLSTSDTDIDALAFEPQGDLLAGIPVLSPLIAQRCYCFPVHRISPDALPEEAPEMPTHLMVYRDRNEAIGFLELNPMTSLLLERLQANQTKPGECVLREIAAEIRHPNHETVISGGLRIMQELRAKDVILGSKRGRYAPIYSSRAATVRVSAPGDVCTASLP